MTAIYSGAIIPDDVWNAIIGGSYGGAEEQQIPPALMAAIAYCETGWRNERSTYRGLPGAPGYDADGLEKSWGPWQINEDGVGAGYTGAQLSDISTNAALARGEILRRLAAGANLLQAIGAWSTAQDAWALYTAHPIVQLTGFRGMA